MGFFPHSGTRLVEWATIQYQYEELRGMEHQACNFNVLQKISQPSCS